MSTGQGGIELPSSVARGRTEGARGDEPSREGRGSKGRGGAKTRGAIHYWLKGEMRENE